MTRVLHLLTGDDEPQAAALAALIADATHRGPGHHHTVLLGGAALRDAARSAGLSPFTLLPRPEALSRLMLPMNRRLMRAIRDADRVDCWSAEAAEIARLAGAPARQPCFADAALLERAERCTDVARLQQCDRVSTRAGWGVADNNYIIALLDPLLHRADASAVGMAMYMVQDVLDSQAVGPAPPPGEEGPGGTGEPPRRAYLLCHPRQRNRHDIEKTFALSGRRGLLIQSPALSCPWRVLPACDACITLRPGGTPTLLDHWASLAGLPRLADAKRPTRQIAHAVSDWIAQHPGTGAGVDRKILSA
jgi:transposase